MRLQAFVGPSRNLSASLSIQTCICWQLCTPIDHSTSAQGTEQTQIVSQPFPDWCLCYVTHADNNFNERYLHDLFWTYTDLSISLIW